MNEQLSRGRGLGLKGTATRASSCLGRRSGRGRVRVGGPVERRRGPARPKRRWSRAQAGYLFMTPRRGPPGSRMPTWRPPTASASLYAALLLPSCASTQAV